MFSLRPDVLPLFVLIGGLLYLLFHEIALARSRAVDRFVPWALLWTVTALLFAGARLMHRTATVPEIAVHSVRAQYALAIAGGFIFIGTLRALAGRETRTRGVAVLFVVGLVLAFLSVATPWVITDHAFLRTDGLGTTYYTGGPGWLLVGLGLYAIACTAWCAEAIRHVRPLPIVGVIAVAVGGLFALNDVLLSAGWLSTIQLFEYTFACIAVMSDVYLTRRLEALRGDLGLAVDERTEALRRSEGRFRELSEGTFEGVLVHRDGVIFDSNEAMARIYQRPSESFLGQDVSELFDPQSHEAIARALRDEAASPVAALGVRSNRECFPVEIEWRSVAAATGARVLVIRDVTERQKLQQHMIRTDRLASMGTLAAGTAHEINNPLSYVIANAQLLGEELRRLAQYAPEGAALEARQLLGEVEEGAARVRRIVRDLMAVAREPDAEIGAIDIAQVVEASAQLARNELRHRARVVLEFAEVPLVRGTEHRLVQVFVNLLLNAAHAIPEGHADEHTVRVRVSRQDHENVLVEVEDDGEGMSPELAEHIFDPFFTTKPVGQGTGLGLAIAHGIVSSLGGKIWVTSTEGVGSTFSLSLPISTGRAPSTRPRTSAPSPSNEEARRVLIVDDEPGVARALQRALRMHEVAVARSGREAIEACAEATFDVIICDLMMPELTGMDVYAALHDRDPELSKRMIFVTGGVFTESARTFLERIENPVFDKPVDLKRLRRVVATHGLGGSRA